MIIVINGHLVPPDPVRAAFPSGDFSPLSSPLEYALTQGSLSAMPEKKK
jgi:hypothetical protein